MLVKHEIDAAPIAGHLSRAVNVIDRSTHIRGGEGDWSKVKPFVPRSDAEAKRFIAKVRLCCRSTMLTSFAATILSGASRSGR